MKSQQILTTKNAYPFCFIHKGIHLSLLLLLLCSTILSFGQTGDFYFDAWKAKSIANPTYLPANTTTLAPTTIVTVDAANVIAKVSDKVYGHNAAVWGGKIEQNAPLLKEVQDLAPRVIRWPGGNMSNDYFWNATSQATCPKDIAPNFVYNDMYYGANKNSWTMPLDSYYDLLSKTNSDGSICVNYAYARYGTSNDPVAVAAHLAADWVRYDRGRTKYWEIGNENYGAWETGYTIDTRYNKDGQPANLTGELYGKHCRVFIDSMRKAAREIGVDIKIGIVLYSSDVAFAGGATKTWNQGVIPQAAAKADFLIVHNYFAKTADTNPTIILNSVKEEVPVIRSLINAQLKNWANLNPMPMAMTEWNINSEGQKQMVSHINGLHGTLMLAELIKSNYGQANRWDFLNGWNNGDTHGLFSDGNEPGTTKFAPRAPYFHMYYFQKFFGDKMVNATVSGNQDILGYASTFSSGQSSVVLVNKGTAAQVVNVKMQNFQTGQRYYYYVLTGSNDNGDFSRKVVVNGQTTSEAGGGPSNYAAIQPYGTAINGAINIVVPRYSVVYMLVEKGVTPTCSASITAPVNSFCAGGNTLLTASAGASYKWFNGTTQVGTAATYTATTSGSYTVEVTYSNGCKATSPAKLITVNPLPLATITSPASSFCAGGSVVLTSSAGASYKWFNGTTQVGTSATYTATTAGNFKVEVTNSTGCKATSAIKSITVTSALTWYADADGDGKGDAAVTKLSCTQPTSYVATAGDACPTDALKSAPGNCGCNKTEASCLDCAGVANGTAGKDACGICAGGTTGRTPVTNPALCGTTTIGINGPACIEVNTPYTYTLTTDNLAVTAINWWSASGAPITKAIGNEKQISITLPSYVSGTTSISAGTSFSASPWYKEYSITVKVGGCTSGTLKALKVSANPLPFNQSTLISLENETIIDKVVVLDINGVEVYKAENIAASNFELGKELAAGIYTAHIYSMHGVSVKKLMKLN